MHLAGRNTCLNFGVVACALTVFIKGYSNGRMIAQLLASEYPEKVRKLVLVVTAARPNPLLLEAVEEWLTLARQDDHTALMDSNLRRIYSREYYRKNKWMIPLIGKLTKPKSYDRVFVQAEACLTHDAFERLHEINAPALARPCRSRSRAS